MTYHALTCEPICPGWGCECWCCRECASCGTTFHVKYPSDSKKTCSKDCRYANKRRPAEERFWEKVSKTCDGGCWIWLGAKSDTGYGSFNVGGGTYVGAHRFAYEVTVGHIPDGLQLDHLCRIRLCVNPAHLEPVTMGENLERAQGRGINFKRRTHCKNGHEYTPENTWVHTDGQRSTRICKTCHKQRSTTSKERYRAKRAESRRAARELCHECPNEPVAQRDSGVAKRDNRTDVRENGRGNDERPTALTADRSSHSDSPQRKGGMAPW